MTSHILTLIRRVLNRRHRGIMVDKFDLPMVEPTPEMRKVAPWGRK